MTFNDIENAEGEPMSRDKFLAKLPAAVIKCVSQLGPNTPLCIYVAAQSPCSANLGSMMLVVGCSRGASQGFGRLGVHTLGNAVSWLTSVLRHEPLPICSFKGIPGPHTNACMRCILRYGTHQHAHTGTARSLTSEVVWER